MAEICEVKEPVRRRGHQAETMSWEHRIKDDRTVQDRNMQSRQQKCIQGFGEKI